MKIDKAADICSHKNTQFACWPCPGNEESAGVNYSHRCPKGNRQMRRVLNQAANAAVKAKGTIFNVVYRRLVPRLGHAQAIGAITYRLCRLIWKMLHQRIRYEERGPAVSVEAKKVRAEDDPRTAKPRVPSRAAFFSSWQSGLIKEIFDPGSSAKLRKRACFQSTDLPQGRHRSDSRPPKPGAPADENAAAQQYPSSAYRSNAEPSQPGWSAVRRKNSSGQFSMANVLSLRPASPHSP
jgi:transposase IS116/IS110/IS902 family protein